MSRNNGKLRKQHDGQFAGSGTDWSFYEKDETYEDVKVDVKTTYDYLSTEQRKSLNGPVKTYHISELEDEENGSNLTKKGVVKIKNKNSTTFRNVRGVKKLVSYLSDTGVPISESTVYNLLRENKIPHQRPSPRVLIFNLDRIDEWIRGA